MPTELVKDVHWVGVVDWGLRHFHGHELSTHRGSAYNAYLVLDEKVALVDTVWGPFRDEFLGNLRSLIDPARIDYVVVNHSEPDHSEALPALMQLAVNAAVVVSRQGAQSVPGHYHQNWNFRPVKTGERISLGRRELVFVEAPMVHWPDSMFTYLAGDAILMPNDAFGQHYATNLRFNDQVSQEELYQEALKYFANILTPTCEQVSRKIEELLGLNLPLSMIAPSHGVLWRKDPLQIVRAYQQWCKQVPQPRAVILYDSMWQATRRMAEAVADGLSQRSVPCKLFHLAVSDRSDVLTEIFQAKAVIVGSPTFNRGVLPTLLPVLEDLRSMRFKNKIGAAFGSFGWSGESVKVIEEHFQRANIPLVAPPVSAKWQPTQEDLAACRALGAKVADVVAPR